MQARAEITAEYARAYQRASKAEKSQLLNEIEAVTGWTRDNARQRLRVAAKPRAALPGKRKWASKYSYDALKVLQLVWAISGGACGKYLVVAMAPLLDALVRHCELVQGKQR